MKNRITANKGFIIALFVMIFSITAVQAQQDKQRGQQGPPPIPNEKQIQKMVGDLSTELSLTDTQKEEVSKIFSAHFKEVKGKLENNKRPDRQEMEKLRADFEKEVKTQLTEEQQKQFDEHMKKQGPPERRQR